LQCTHEDTTLRAQLVGTVVTRLTQTASKFLIQCRTEVSPLLHIVCSLAGLQVDFERFFCIIILSACSHYTYIIIESTNSTILVRHVSCILYLGIVDVARPHRASGLVCLHTLVTGDWE